MGTYRNDIQYYAGRITKVTMDLFKTKDDFYDQLVENGMPEEEARNKVQAVTDEANSYALKMRNI